ncbi:MAG: hypothetical protein AAGG08_10750 [Actinomycetota bacterium]
MSGVQIQNWPKTLLLVTAIVCATGLLALERISEAGGVGIISGALFYGLGNGIAARQGKPVEPALGRADDTPRTP